MSFDGAPYEVKVSRTVWRRGKARDDIKGLPIPINGTSSYARSFTDGGEIFFGGMGDHWNVPAYSFDPTGKYENKTKMIRNCFFDNKESINLCDHINPGKHSTELFSDITIDFLENYELEGSEDPFFAYVSFMAPHDPRSMPDKFLNMYDPAKIKLPENFQAEHFNYGVKELRDEVLAPYPRTPEEVKRHIAEYYGMISHLDYEIGRVLDTLEKSGQADNTIIVFAGDNGLAVGQHGLMGKQNHYEHSIRVPLIFAGPGIPENEKTDTYLYLLDIFPTLCELLDIEIPESVEGRSLLPAINNKEEEIRETLYFVYTDLMRGVKDKRYKLIEYVGNDSYKTQLFDIVEDPLEMNNLFGSDEYKKVVIRLRAELIKYRDAWDDCSHPLGEKFWSGYKKN